MKYTVVVHSSPYSGQSARTALSFCRELINRQHQLLCVFFFHDGVSNAARWTESPQGEVNLPAQWSSFHENSAVPLLLCVSAGARRGLVDQQSDMEDEPIELINDGFEIAGLGRLVEASTESDRLITFGN